MKTKNAFRKVITLLTNVFKTTMFIIFPIIALVFLLPAAIPLVSEHANTTKTSEPFSLSATDKKNTFITAKGHSLILKTQHPISIHENDAEFVFKQIEFRSGYSRPCIAPSTSISLEQCFRFSIDDFEFINIETALKKL